MSVIRRSIAPFLITVVLGAVLLGSGCMTAQPGGSVPATAAPAAGTLSDLTFHTRLMWPAAFVENGTLRGISVDLFELATGKMGYKISRDQVRVEAGAEATEPDMTQNRSVFFTIARIPGRGTALKYAGPVTPYVTVLFARPGSGIVISGPEDLKKYRIGVVGDTASALQVQAVGMNQSLLVQETNASLLAQKLAGGEIDLWAYPETPGRYLIRAVTGNSSSFGIVYTLPALATYYAFSSDVPDATVQAFQQALDAVKNDRQAHGYSEYERIFYQYTGVGCARETLSDKDVMNLVNTTAAAIEKNAPDTFRRINAAEAPYHDPVNTALYVFVFDTNVTVVANADNKQIVGVNVRGKTDMTGRPFRDEIVAGALRNGSGWEDYVFIDPAEAGLYSKTSYYRLVTGSDNRTYIVGSGKYKTCTA